MLSSRHNTDLEAQVRPLPSYQAKKLERPKTRTEKVLNVLYWAFPPLALWGALKFGMNRILGKTIGQIVLPATKTQKKGSAEEIKYQKDRQQFEAELQTGTLFQSLKATEHCVITPDGAKLNTLTISPQVIPANPKDRVYIIKFTGNSGYFEKTNNEEKFNVLEEAVDEVKDKDCQFILFNYRGVGKSTGSPRSYHDLIADVFAQVDRLVTEQGADPEKIYFKAHSLGGAISTISAQRAHDLNLKVREYNSRSFALLSDVAAGEGWLRPLKKFIYKAIFVLTGWEIDAGSAMKKLPETHRDYYCVRSSKADREANKKYVKSLDALEKQKNSLLDDITIPHPFSIHKAMKPERFKEVQHKNPGLNTAEIKKKVKAESNRHKMTVVPGKNGHDASTRELQSRYRAPNRPLFLLSADDHFNAFFKRSNPNYVPGEKALKDLIKRRGMTTQLL